jgi:hypothetical protein
MIITTLLLPLGHIPFNFAHIFSSKIHLELGQDAHIVLRTSIEPPTGVCPF